MARQVFESYELLSTMFKFDVEQEAIDLVLSLDKELTDVKLGMLSGYLGMQLKVLEISFLNTNKVNEYRQ